MHRKRRAFEQRGARVLGLPQHAPIEREQLISRFWKYSGGKPVGACWEGFGGRGYGSSSVRSVRRDGSGRVAKTRRHITAIARCWSIAGWHFSRRSGLFGAPGVSGQRLPAVLEWPACNTPFAVNAKKDRHELRTDCRVDLGSNSFRLQIGRVVGDRIHPLDTLKETVRLGSGLTREKLLDHASQQRAIDALRRFGERLRGFAPEPCAR
jgi:hypothetical protein